MATTIEELRAVMRMELKPFMRDLQQMNGISAKAARQVEQTWLQTNRRLDGIGKNMAQSLIAPLTGVAAALGARELIRLTDVWTDLNGRVRIAAGGMREGTEVMGRLSDMARRTYSSLETTAESYLTNSQALKELGYSTNQQLDFTEALNNALVVSGAKGQRAEQVIQALGKAMAFGELRGENLNTVIQTGGRVAQALAEGLGVTTNELRKMGEQGKLKSSSVFTALTSQMQTLRDEADGMQATIGDAIQLLQNSFLEYVGGADQASGASARIAEAIILVADNMDTAANAALFAAQAIIGALAGRAMVGAGIQIVTTTKALAEFVRIARAAQGLGGLGPAFASLGANAGVIGLVVGGAAALALGHFANQANEAGKRTDRFNTMLERMGIKAKEAAEQIDEAAAAQERLSTAEGISAHQQDTDDAKAKLAEFTSELEKFASVLRVSAGDADSQTASMSKAIDEYLRAKRSAKSLGDELDELATKFPDWAGDITNIKVWVAGINDARTALGMLADEMAGIGTPTIAQQNHNTMIGADRASMAPIIAGQEYLSEQNRRNALTREQRDLEDEILRIRRDMETAKPGAILSEREIEGLARASLATKAADRKTGGSGAKADPYGDATKDMQRRIDMLVEETRLLGDINPLINDYGFAVEKLRAAQELENAAAKAGIELGPAQREQIEQISTAYAQATADAARLAEAQGLAKSAFDDLNNAARSALDSIIDGFIEGKDAGEIFSNVLRDLSKQLLNVGLNMLLGSIFPGGGIISGLFGGRGFATGTANTGGRRGEPRGVVHGQEAVIPLPNGGRVPVDLRMPSLPQTAAAQPMALTVHVVSDDEKFSAYVTDKAGQVVGGAAPAIIKTSVGASPAATLEKQMRYGAA